jgi:NAD(P)-dependent dehydrogenase (short-subunit alcohol dehydrogenase family)
MSTDLFDLSGDIALVTGASRGIGEAIARLLAAHGAHVIVSSRKLEACEVVAASIREAGGKATAVAAHLGDPGAIQALYAQLDVLELVPTVLVNNAAANPYFGPVLDMGLDAFEKTVEVNIRGYWQCSVEAARRMKAAGGGRIVNVASVNGVRPAPMQTCYSMTKAAILSMTQGFAKEWAAHGIRVNALLPGLTETKFASTLTQNPAILNQFLKLVPLNRVAQPEEMAPAVLFLASKASSYLTGTTITADGGYLA